MQVPRTFLTAVMAFIVLLPMAVRATPAEDSAAAFIRQLGEATIAAAHAEGLSPAAREEQLRDLIGRGFDLEFVGRFVLGRYWNRVAHEHRAAYTELFGAYVTRVFSARLGGYAGETFEIDGVKPAGERDVLVATRIVRPGKSPLTVAWRVRGGPGQERIIDVMVAGVSMAVTQRSEFASVIQRTGFDGLLAALRAHVS